MKPFKTKILKFLIQYMPQNFNNYFELFCGGSSFFFEIFEKDSTTYEYSISDINEMLMTCYKTIKHDVTNVILELSKECYSNTKENYLKNRIEYNDLKFMNGYNIQKTSCSYILINVDTMECIEKTSKDFSIFHLDQ